MWLAQENGKLQLKNIAPMMLPQKAFTPEEFALISWPSSFLLH